jgi:DNA-binding LacI/PurR family transcriptional regulator
MAFGALRALREAGLCVPRDIAVVGFDDLPTSSLADPPLTTVRQPIRRLGVQAVETLIDILNNGPEPPRRITLSTELIIRASGPSETMA